MKITAMILALACMAGAARAEDCSDPIIKKPEDAGRVAFTMWHIVNPNFTESDERKWLSAFTITLHGCIWYVAAKPEPGHSYSTFAISIGAKDGRFLGAVISD